MDTPINSTLDRHEALLEHWMTGGEIVPAQLAGGSVAWTPEKRLAAAVLSAALAEVRHPQGRRGKRQSAVTLQWIASNDTAWPYSFVRLCQLFEFDVAWVRQTVRLWQSLPESRQRRAPAYRTAA